MYTISSLILMRYVVLYKCVFWWPWFVLIVCTACRSSALVVYTRNSVDKCHQLRWRSVVGPCNWFFTLINLFNIRVLSCDSQFIIRRKVGDVLSYSDNFESLTLSKTRSSATAKKQGVGYSRPPSAYCCVPLQTRTVHTVQNNTKSLYLTSVAACIQTYYPKSVPPVTADKSATLYARYQPTWLELHGAVSEVEV